MSIVRPSVTPYIIIFYLILSTTLMIIRAVSSPFYLYLVIYGTGSIYSSTSVWASPQVPLNETFTLSSRV